MYCSNCGEPIEIGDRYCTNCGEKLDQKNKEEVQVIKTMTGTEEINWKLVEATSNGINIPKSVRQYFKESIRENSPIKSIEIIQKYQKNDICDKNGNLTERGRVVAISYLPLEEQCNILGIKLECEPIPIEGETEKGVLKFYKKQGYKGCYSESEIISVILYCICFNRLFPLHLEKYNEDINSSCWVLDGKKFTIAESYSQSIGAYGRYFNQLKTELINLIENANEQVIRENFNKIFRMQYPYNQERWEYQGIDENLVVDIYKGLGNEEIARTGIYYLNSLSQGWPDLAIVKDNKVRFIEVKRKDKIRRSQIIMFKDLKKSTRLDISVLKII